MSYNISTFKLKTLKNFSFPVSSIYKSDREDWHPDKLYWDDGSVTFEIMETEFHGRIENDIFHMETISCEGEGSGTIMNDVLEPAFEDSVGELEAFCVWEGGDSINKLEVHDGVVKWMDIEI